MLRCIYICRVGHTLILVVTIHYHVGYMGQAHEMGTCGQKCLSFGHETFASPYKKTMKNKTKGGGGHAKEGLGRFS